MEVPLQEEVKKAARDAVSEELNSVMSDKRYINLERVPLICQSIVRIDSQLQSIQDNLVWGVRIVLGAVILALIATLYVK